MAAYTGERTTGFASPATGSVEGPIDLAAVLSLTAPGRYPVRVAGASGVMTACAPSRRRVTTSVGV